MDTSAVIEDVIKHVAAFLHVECRVEIQSQEQAGRTTVAVAIHTTEPAPFLIGNVGQHLQALEHILRLAVARQRPMPPLLALDINDYKKIKTDHAIQIAKEAIEQIRTTSKPLALPPMSSFERRAVHTELMAYPDIATESIGEDPQRRVVIKPV